ncbi:MAG: hypothetical protein ACLFRV_05460 [Acidimicrobiales bacterium]
MPRRIEVELTSQRDDGTWTWRAAGARQPKGTLAGTLLFDGAKVGDVVRADAEFDVDGIDIVSVQPPKEDSRREPERIELVSSGPADDQLVTTTLAPKGRGGRGRGDEGRRKPRKGRSDEGGDRPRRERRPRPEGGDRQGRPRGERRNRPAPPPIPEKPKPKRLRPLRHHRNAVLDSLPEAERPIAEQVLRGGVPAVRQAVDKQNEQAVSEGQPTIKAEPLVAIAERLLPQLRTAEWHDRADAALENLDELDLRDLRSVVVAADTAARDDETRELAANLREGLNRRVEEEHHAWLRELDETLTAGRVVRALRLSSRPPKAGAPLPPELAQRLADAASAAFGPEVTQERWATVLDAVTYSPVRQHVTPVAFPEQPSDELLAAVRKVASRVPAIAAHFGIEATEAGGRKGRGRSKSTGKGRVPAPPPAPDPAPEPPAQAPPPSTPEPTTEPEAAPAEASAEAAEVAEAVEEATDPSTSDTDTTVETNTSETSAAGESDIAGEAEAQDESDRT